MSKKPESQETWSLSYYPPASTPLWEVTDATGNLICRLPDTTQKTAAQVRANAELIVEAGNIAKQTGRTPRQLHEEYTKLQGICAAMLDQLERDYESDDEGLPDCAIEATEFFSKLQKAQ